ncbi:MAG: futalosine hydrolase [Chitinophagaceae bacterium]|nr:futalosine hydrolase [Bacteroidota bacterium]MCC6257152.1 futalosine hydrolase [Chitinophagaceae bacterium]MCW5917719.1 futalosine hydrolase [Ferruginibacter sp.]
MRETKTSFQQDLRNLDMQILVVSATEMEIAPFMKAFPEQEVLITGVGAPSALFQLCRRFSQADYQFVIQAGIAGSFKQETPFGMVVAVARDCFADLGIVENKRIIDLVTAGLATANDGMVCAGWIDNPSAANRELGIACVDAVTVNLTGDTPILSGMIQDKYHPDIESMEGAAFHFACHEFKQPYLQLRAISNHVGERDKSKWRIKEAITNLNNELVRIMAQLKKGNALNEVYNDHD